MRVWLGILLDRSDTVALVSRNLWVFSCSLLGCHWSNLVPHWICRNTEISRSESQSLGRPYKIHLGICFIIMSCDLWHYQWLGGQSLKTPKTDCLSWGLGLVKALWPNTDSHVDIAATYHTLTNKATFPWPDEWGKCSNDHISEVIAVTLLLLWSVLGLPVCWRVSATYRKSLFHCASTL